MACTGCVTFDQASLERAASVMSWGSPDLVSARKTPRNPLADQLQLLSRSGPKPTDRTLQVLRQNGLEATYLKNRNQGLLELQQSIDAEPTADKALAFAELAYIAGKNASGMMNEAAAFDMYGASVAHAYAYLFDPRFEQTRNAYDPEFRHACDLYNNALEGALRIIDHQGNLKPGHKVAIESCGQHIVIDIQIKGSWHEDDFARFEFVSDYEVQGLNNRHQTFGLGVPLIAIRNQHPDETPAEKYYPQGLAFPVTAFLRVANEEVQQVAYESGETERCVLELCDPLATTDVTVAGRRAPLESDISTPLAYYLNNPVLKSNTFATWALLNADFAEQYSGVYMMEPYSPDKIPVVMVHGLWSSPVTWMQMYNDLRSMPEVREKYQFWFYLYPSGQPFWISAKQMRSDMAELRRSIDPAGERPLLDQTVLIGHSMGGLVSKMQTVYSKNDFWDVVSERPFEELKANEAARTELAETLFFEPNPSIRRVITIGTPHRGSDYANRYTTWLSRQLIALPSMLSSGGRQVVRENPDFFRNTDLITTTTSIDSLSPKSPIFPVLLKAEKSSRVRYHNIVGNATKEASWLGSVGESIGGEGDGVVSLASAKVEEAESEIEVDADHTGVHQHPLSVLEVRRILLEHLEQTEIEQHRSWAQQKPPAQNQPAGFYLDSK